jgi:mannose-6-phosphate isomerase-like protein (cupin superfamily)
MPVVDTAGLPERQPKEGWRGRFFNSDRMTFGYYVIEPDADLLHEHHHEQEEVWHVIEGELAIAIDGVESVLGPGMAGVVPAGTPHSARPLGRVRAIVVDTPVRDQVGGTRLSEASPVDYS